MGRGFEPHTSPQNSKDLVLKSTKSFLHSGVSMFKFEGHIVVNSGNSFSD